MTDTRTYTYKRKGTQAHLKTHGLSACQGSYIKPVERSRQRQRNYQVLNTNCAEKKHVQQQQVHEEDSRRSACVRTVLRGEHSASVEVSQVLGSGRWGEERGTDQVRSRPVGGRGSVVGGRGGRPVRGGRSTAWRRRQLRCGRAGMRVSGGPLRSLYCFSIMALGEDRMEMSARHIYTMAPTRSGENECPPLLLPPLLPSPCRASLISLPPFPSPRPASLILLPSCSPLASPSFPPARRY